MWQYNHTNQIELYHHNYDNNELYHYGVAGMKWGVRRKYLNTDGSLNKKGIKKYAKAGYRQDIRKANAKADTATKIKRIMAFGMTPFASGGIKLLKEDKRFVDKKFRKESLEDNQKRAERYLREKQKKPKKKIPSKDN